MVNCRMKVVLSKYKLQAFQMSNRNEGLTVGELTMVIAVLIFIGLVWNISNQKGENTELSSGIEKMERRSTNI